MKLSLTIPDFKKKKKANLILPGSEAEMLRIFQFCKSVLLLQAKSYPRVGWL
jgi:hypothetical protein